MRRRRLKGNPEHRSIGDGVGAGIQAVQSLIASGNVLGEQYPEYESNCLPRAPAVGDKCADWPDHHPIAGEA
eukprot:4671805-Prymnesium_polylepis.1